MATFTKKWHLVDTVLVHEPRVEKRALGCSLLGVAGTLISGEELGVSAKGEQGYFTAFLINILGEISTSFSSFFSLFLF